MSTIYPFHPQYYEYPSNRLCNALHESGPCYNGRIDDPLDPEQQRHRDFERIRNFRLIDDDFMNVVFDDRPCAELLLHVILEQPDLAVHSVETQKWMQNLHGRSARLDILARDAIGASYNVEVQRADSGAAALRARYYSSLIDANITEPGERFQNLRKNCVILITENDVIGGGLPIYHINRTIEETGARFGDDTQIIYVNSQIRDVRTPLGRLMHDFWSTSYEDMYYKELADRVRYFKTNEEGQISMCEALEQMRNEVAEAAAKRNSIQIALTMLAANKLCHDDIAAYTGLTLAEVNALDERQPA